MCVDRMVALFGNVTSMLCCPAGWISVHGQSKHAQWPEQPESAMPSVIVEVGLLTNKQRLTDKLFLLSELSTPLPNCQDLWNTSIDPPSMLRRVA